ncbi:MAG TPA: ATP-binding protein [Verrucomicrobiae bacterium]|nr:ATP-binding protein [Verrucomicrobiae bacterium]
MKGLRSARLFKEIPGVELQSLERAARLIVFKTGEIIFQEGDPGDGLYVIAQGKVQITAFFGENQRRALTHVGAGDFFGEMALLDGEPRSAGAFAEEETQTYFIPRDALLASLERSPKLAVRMLRDFSRRLREFNHQYVHEVLQAERLGLVGRFARSIIHDFKNPLHIIGVSAEMSAVKGTSGEAQTAARERIRRQVDRISKMITEFLEFSRGERSSINLLETDYAAFVRDVLEEIRSDTAARSVKIDLQNQPPAVNLMLDSARLTHVFCNLVGNACDAMPDGGRITLRFSKNLKEVITEIEDSGKGIAPQAMPRLFEPFMTYGKPGGTGLGLSICKKIIEDHGGEISARNQPGRGALFVFKLPLPGSAQRLSP